jgi:hypothetical protein
LDLFRSAANFFDALGQPLNAEEISLRELSRHFGEKRPIAAPKVDMQRRSAPEKLHKIKTRNLQFRQEFDHTEKCGHLAYTQLPMCALVPSHFEIDVLNLGASPLSHGERMKVRGST